MTIAATPVALRASAQRRLLSAARSRFAEDALADAVSAGTRQVVLLGTALDTFACHNPYPSLRVFEVTNPDLDLVTATTDFDHDSPAFVIRLRTELPPIFGVEGDGTEETGPSTGGAGVGGLASGNAPLPTEPKNDASVTVTLRLVGGFAPGSEIVFDQPPHLIPSLSELLGDTGFELLEDLGPRELASRYLDRPIGSTHSSEPHVLWARVRNNAGRPPSSLVAR
ncbi:MAG: SAM-dependent methyltransferase [Nocardia sp.]|uniref:class I SAM-dependent methyltransferase n=1 Tax=Nocardia sp. TaxID=1821 RepID=UPI002637328E|nr:class I SAM-dependent methyltransferase [Nocardia sp.]MCU1647197.1 SAM-dependent methyltransferase [Nocardia sp.]